MVGDSAIRLPHSRPACYRADDSARGVRMADIFISYSKKDRAIAEELAAFLESCGYSVWWDTNLVAGTVFRETIAKEIAQARAALVLWSRHSAKSAFVIDEAESARRLGKLISLHAPDFPPAKVPLGFGTAHVAPLAEGASVLKGRRGDVPH